MNESSIKRFEERVEQTAAAFVYPPAPDIAAKIQQELAPARNQARQVRRWAAGAVLALIICIVAAATISPVRAALLRILQIGAIQINMSENAALEATPEPRPVSLADLGQTITYAEAAELLTLREPAYPPAMGEADAIFGQNLLNLEPVVTFFWNETADRPQIALTQIEIPGFGIKWASGEQITQTTVAGQPAIWIEGPHVLDLHDFAIDQEQIVASNVLIWSLDGITFRMEGAISLTEARQIAESWP